MIRPVVRLALAALLALPTTATAQKGAALIKKLGESAPVADVTFPADRAVEYKVMWDVTEAPEKAGELVAGFRRPANFLVMTDREGVSRTKVHLAIIVYGKATGSLLNADAYRAAHGVENQSIPLLEALNEAGVQIIVCGQAIMNRKVPRADLLPFVKVATSASMARATLQAQGYARLSP